MPFNPAQPYSVVQQNGQTIYDQAGTLYRSTDLQAISAIPADEAVATVVEGASRNCVGRQTLSVTTGAVSTLSPPIGAVAATIQADGSAVSVTLDGSTAPTATVGTRLDDGVIYNVDTPLAKVKLIARSVTTNVQVAYFDKP